MNDAGRLVSADSCGGDFRCCLRPDGGQSLELGIRLISVAVDTPLNQLGLVLQQPVKGTEAPIIYLPLSPFVTTGAGEWFL